MAEKKSEITLEAFDKNLEAAQEFVRTQLKLICDDTKTQLQIDLVVEEVFVNIAHYAYAPKTGSVTISCIVSTEPARLTVTFTDSGTPFDPLKKADPDVTLGSEERSIGGLGIFLVKKFMTTTAYDYKDGKNIFTITLDF
ncbi:MAG: ATP-binding protein [Treponema sp.]|nr:ATP-binding protein [Treponema sp.]